MTALGAIDTTMASSMPQPARGRHHVFDGRDTGLTSPSACIGGIDDAVEQRRISIPPRRRGGRRCRCGRGRTAVTVAR
jgi:hypothetical protein